MGRYRVRVATGAWLFSGSLNRVQLWLVGERGEAELELRLRPARGQVRGGGGDPDAPRPGRAGRRGAGQRARGGGASRSRAPGSAGEGRSPAREGLIPPSPSVVLAASAPFPSDPRPLALWNLGSGGRSPEGAGAGRAQPADGAGDEAPGSTQDPGASPRVPRPLGAMGRRRPARRCWEEAAPSLEASSPDSTKDPAPPADVPSWVPATECHGVLVPTGGGV